MNPKVAFSFTIVLTLAMMLSAYILTVNEYIKEGILLKGRGNAYSFNKSAMFRG